MKLQKTITIMTGILLLMSQMALAGNNPPIPAAFSKPRTIRMPSTADLTEIPSDAREISLLGCINSRPACRPNFILQRTGCPTTPSPYTYDSDYECYTCVTDPALTNKATCPSGWTLRWTSSGYSCSSDCRESCRNNYNKDQDLDSFDKCLSSCPSAPSLIDGHGCSEGFTQYNQERSSYSCVFDNAPTTTQDPVCATCGAQGSHIDGTDAEFNCVRRVRTNPAPASTGTTGSGEATPDSSGTRGTRETTPECSRESTCNDGDPCTYDKCVTDEGTPYCNHVYLAELCPAKPTSDSGGSTSGSSKTPASSKPTESTDTTGSTGKIPTGKDSGSSAGSGGAPASSKPTGSGGISGTSGKPFPSGGVGGSGGAPAPKKISNPFSTRRFFLGSGGSGGK